MGSKVVISRIGRTGVITLNRPEAINALDREMIDLISSGLETFLSDDGIAAVLIEGAGEKGFCAGGDVRAVRDAVVAGDLAAAEGYFAAEYALDRAIAEAAKPVIALTDGVVMGGGIGLAGHARYRITTDRARFAMPEAAIGFFCDVGVNAILAAAPRHRALAFMLAARPVGAADALALGLTDCVIAAKDMLHMREELFRAVDEGDAATSIVNMMQAHGIEAGPGKLVQLADRLETCFGGVSARDIIAALATAAQTDPDAAEFGAAVLAHCPTTHEANIQCHDAARTDRSLSGVFARDLALAGHMCRRADFSEGVRAVLVDKDRSPKWSPVAADAVDPAAITAVLAGYSEQIV